MTERVDAAGLAVPNDLGVSLEMNHQAFAGSGATGARTASWTAPPAADAGITHMLALRPAVVIVTPGSFNAFETGTAGGAITGVIQTKVAGSAFSLDVVAISGGVQQAGFTDAVIVELLGNNTLGVALDAQNCPTSFTLVQTVAPNPTITGGRSTVNFAAVANSWRDVRVRVRWPTASPTVAWCSTDNFAIRPNTLASFAVTDTDWQTAGTGRALDLLTFAATTPTHKAGRPFSVRASAVNAAGVPATTTNYTGAPTATLAACAGAACTATFGTLSLNTTFAAGQLVSDIASYNEVGSFALQLVDSTFASVDSADTAGDCTATGRHVCSAAINVGRFVPDHFAVALNAPVFAPACGPFTYIGQAFNYSTAPVITVTAQDFANNTTTLYHTAGSWWRITNASLAGKSYTAAVGVLDVTGVPGTDPVIASAGLGAGTLSFSSGTGLFFTRSTPTAPASPYDADVSLAINVIDADGVTLPTNPARFGTATAGNGIAFSDGSALTMNDKQMRFGRLVIRNANGSQLVPLPVLVEAQYWSGAPMNTFITNTQDSCTSIAAANETMANYTGNLSGSPTCETAIGSGGALNSGRRTLLLAAPGSGNGGSVDVTVNLGASASGNTCIAQGGAPGSATAANLPHLQGNWTGGAYDANPTARAAFGLFRGAEEVVFVRENF
jgi:MSHA biogenesis protein MshQ